MSRPDIEAIRARAEAALARASQNDEMADKGYYSDTDALHDYVAALEEIARAVLMLDTVYADRPKPMWFGSLDPIIDRARALLGE